MRKQYYDIELITEILNLVKENPYGAVIKFERYLSKYSEDYSAYMSMLKLYVFWKNTKKQSMYWILLTKLKINGRLLIRLKRELCKKILYMLK